MNTETNPDYWKKVLADIQTEMNRDEQVPESEKNAIRYVNILLWSMVNRGCSELVIKQSEPLPILDVPDANIERVPGYREVIDRLKCMCNLTEGCNPPTSRGQIKVSIEGRN